MQPVYPATAPQPAASWDTILGRYNRDPLGARAALIICSLFFLAGLACALLLLGLPRPDTGNGGYFLDPLVGFLWNLLWVGRLVGLATGIIGIPIAFYSAVIIGKQQLTVYESGFVLQHGNVPRYFRWGNVESCSFMRAVDYGATAGASPGSVVKLRMDDGSRFTFDNSYRGPGNLAMLLTSATYSPTLERVAGQLLSGRPVALGSLAISPAGLSFGKKQVPWIDLAGAACRSTRFIVWTRDPRQPQNTTQPASVPLQQVPNALALAAIVQAISVTRRTLPWDQAVRSLLAENRASYVPLATRMSTANWTTGEPIQRVKPRALVLLGLLGMALVVGGGALLLSGLSAGFDASNYARARTCAPGQTTGCVQKVTVSVLTFDTQPVVRGSSIRTAAVLMPGGDTREFNVQDGDLFPRLQIDQELTAQLWNDKITSLDDGQGHYMITSDDPAWLTGNNTIAGLLIMVMGGFFLVALVLTLLRRLRTAGPGS